MQDILCVCMCVCSVLESDIALWENRYPQVSGKDSGQWRNWQSWKAWWRPAQSFKGLGSHTPKKAIVVEGKTECVSQCPKPWLRTLDVVSKGKLNRFGWSRGWILGNTKQQWKTPNWSQFFSSHKRPRSPKCRSAYNISVYSWAHEAGHWPFWHARHSQAGSFDKEFRKKCVYSADLL